MIVLLTLTAFFVCGICGTIGKMLFDDWRAKAALLPVVAALE